MIRSFVAFRTHRTLSLAVFIGAGMLGAARPAIAHAQSQCDQMAGNLVANCGFETGTFSSYTRSGDTASSGVDQISSHTGSYGAYFGTRGASQTLAQTLATTAGTPYTISFSLLSEDALPGPAFFRAFFGGQSVFDLSGQAPLDYTSYRFTGIATGATTELQFVTQNDLSFYDLDDVSVTLGATTIPEPTTVALIGGGLLALGAAARRRRVR